MPRFLGAFLGRKTISATNIGRATTAIRGAGRAIKESKDVGQAEENVSALQQQLADLEAQFKDGDRCAGSRDRSPQRETRNRLSQTHQSQHRRETRRPRLDASLAGCEGADPIMADAGLANVVRRTPPCRQMLSYGVVTDPVATGACPGSF